MTFIRHEQLLPRNDVWIITGGITKKFDLSTVFEGIQSTLVKEYRISDLAKYLLDPNPIEVRKILVGCELHFHSTFFHKAKRRLRQHLPGQCRALFKENKVLHEILTANYEPGERPLKDKDLESHVEKIHSALSDYDPLLKRLSKLDTNDVDDITGICEDIGGNRSVLNLKGDVKEKIHYIRNYLLNDVGVILEKAHVADGLFDMSGFDFTSFNPRNSHLLLKTFDNGRPKFCVIGPNGKIAYWVENPNLINHMHLLEHSIKANPKLSDSLRLCTKGDAKPLRLLFKKQLEIDYAKSPIPSFYQELFDACKIETNEQKSVIRSLKNSQLGILFNYVPNTDSGVRKLLTNISVMHDVRALESIKEDLPRIYSEINKRASVSEAGKYYLLDYLKGCGDE